MVCSGVGGLKLMVCSGVDGGLKLMVSLRLLLVV